MPRACSKLPGDEVPGQVGEAVLVVGVVEQVLAGLDVPRLWWECIPEPLIPKNGFGMKVA